MQFIACIFLLVFASVSLANESTARITIEADSFETELGGALSTYTGNVIVVQHYDTLMAERIVILRTTQGISTIKSWGDPATLKRLDPIEPLSATAQYIIFEQQDDFLTLEDNASVMLKNNMLSGDYIFINLSTQEIRATAAKNERVRMTIDPQNLKQK